MVSAIKMGSASGQSAITSSRQRARLRWPSCDVLAKMVPVAQWANAQLLQCLLPLLDCWVRRCTQRGRNPPPSQHLAERMGDSSVRCPLMSNAGSATGERSFRAPGLELA